MVRKKAKKKDGPRLDESKKFLLKFVALIVVLYGIVAIRPVNDAVIVPFTERIASATAWVLVPFSENVSVDGTLVTDGRASVNIENGCNAVEASIILIAAVVAFPATPRSKLFAVAGGVIGLQLVNLIRTSSLFLLLKHKPSLFEIAHGGVWQVLLVLLALIFFIVWSSKQPRGAAE